MQANPCAIIDSGDYDDIDVKELTAKILELINIGVTDFWFTDTSGYFEMSCIKIIGMLKKAHPDIKRILIAVTNKNLEKAYLKYDEVFLPGYKSLNIQARIAERRRYIVKAAAYGLCYVDCLRDKVRIFEYAYLRSEKTAS